MTPTDQVEQRHPATDPAADSAVPPLPRLLSRVHLIGIGGAAMSGIARILLARGAMVSGSDAKDSRAVLALRALGAEVAVGHDAHNLDLLPGGPTCLVTTKAVHQADPDNPELLEAARARHPGAPPFRGARRADGRPPRRVRDGHARARRRPRRCSSSRCSTAASTRRSRSAATSLSSGSSAHHGMRRRLRRRGRRERRLVPRLLAGRRDRHQRRGRPPRPLRHASRPTSRSSTPSPRGSSRAAPS